MPNKLAQAVLSVMAGHEVDSLQVVREAELCPRALQWASFRCRELMKMLATAKDDDDLPLHDLFDEKLIADETDKIRALGALLGVDLLREGSGARAKARSTEPRVMREWQFVISGANLKRLLAAS